MKTFALTLAVSLTLQATLYSEPARKTISGIEPNPAAGFYTEADRFVFFAVLEGCYNDGLLDEDIDLIFPLTSKGGRDHYANFILSCPLCGPASDAFQLYAERMQLSKQIIKRTSYRTFGPGLSTEIRAELQKPGQPCRDAIQGLIGKWVSSRILTLRLDEEETTALRDELAKMRKKGEKALSSFQNANNGNALKERYKDWETCPVCSGAAPMGNPKP